MEENGKVYRTWMWNGASLPPGPVVVFDIDGVLADSAHRQHHITGPKESHDWYAFFAACADDEQINEIRSILDVIDDTVGIVLLTSRPIAVREQTLVWASRHDLPWDLLIMRESREDMSSREFKTFEAQRLLDEGYEIRVVFDDDIRNIEAFHEIGLPAVYIHSGYYN